MRLKRALFCVLTSAAFTHSAHAEQGFYTAANLSIPGPVEEAGNSVLKILFKHGSGSGFVVTDSQTLWTAAHVVDIEKSGANVGTNLHLVLVNNLGVKVFDSTNGSDTATVTRYRPESRDLAEIQLSRALDCAPLSINTQTLDTHLRVYSVGYPAVTDAVIPTSETVRDSIYISRATFGDITSNAGHLINIDMEVYFGQSGSPLLNASGEVIGVIVMVNAVHDEAGNNHVVSYAESFNQIVNVDAAFANAN